MINFLFSNKPASECEMVKDNILLRVCNYNNMNKCVFLMEKMFLFKLLQLNLYKNILIKFNIIKIFN